MDKLFHEVKELSTIHKISEKELLESHINQVMELIINSHEAIIRSYASKHYNNAILLIINSNFLYNKIINIQKLLEPDSYLIKKHEEYNIKLLIKRLTDFFHPFKINILRGNSILKLIEHNINYKINIDNIYNNIICVVVSWDE